MNIDDALRAQWAAVDRYITDRVVVQDEALLEAVRSSEAAGLPPIAVSACQGKLLHVLAKTIGAKRVLEVGTLGGYSTIWLGRALGSGGRLITLEIDEKCAEVATRNIRRAGLSDAVEIRLGPALDAMAGMYRLGVEPFDLVFIDADKPATADYFDWALNLTRRGSLIITDNVIRKGQLINEGSDDADVHGMRRFMDRLAAEKAVTATVIQTVGAKGYDGLAIAVVN